MNQVIDECVFFGVVIVNNFILVIKSYLIDGDGQVVMKGVVIECVILI